MKMKVQRRLVMYRAAKKADKSDGDWGIVCCGKRCSEDIEDGSFFGEIGIYFQCRRCGWEENFAASWWNCMVAQDRPELPENIATRRGYKKPTRKEWYRRVKQMAWERRHPQKWEHAKDCTDPACRNRTFCCDTSGIPGSQVVEL